MTARALRVSAPVTVVPLGTTPRDALALMARHEIRHLPLVTRPAEGDPVCVGLLVDRDVAAVVGTAGTDGAVDRLARTDVPRVAPDDPPRAVARAVLRGGCDAALVVEQGCLVGIVTATDVLRRVTEEGS